MAKALMLLGLALTGLALYSGVDYWQQHNQRAAIVAEQTVRAGHDVYVVDATKHYLIAWFALFGLGASALTAGAILARRDRRGNR